jgi:hypothetical protein
VRLHERTINVDRAENDLRLAIDSVVHEHDLTTWEALRVVSSAANSYILGLAKVGIRIERHGDPNALGDVAGG